MQPKRAPHRAEGGDRRARNAAARCRVPCAAPRPRPRSRRDQPPRPSWTVAAAAPRRRCSRPRALRREAWWMAAVLAAGPGAALSYRTAAELRRTVVSPQHLKGAVDEAEVRRLTSPTSLDALLERYPGAQRDDSPEAH